MKTQNCFGVVIDFTLRLAYVEFRLIWIKVFLNTAAA